MNSFQNIRDLVKEKKTTPKHERSVEHKLKKSGSLEKIQDKKRDKSKLKSAKRSQDQLDMLNETENLQYSN